VLPGEKEARKGWEQYLRNWRPGKPHPDTWPVFFREAWRIVNGIPAITVSQMDTGADVPNGGAAQ